MSRESSPEQGIYLPHNPSPTSSKSPHSSPKCSQKRKRTEDLDERIAKRVKCEMGKIYDHINALVRKNIEQQKQIQEQKTVINELNGEVSNLKREIVTLNSKIEIQEMEIVTLRSKIETQDREIEYLATENEEQGEKIDSLSSQIDELKEDMEGRMDNVRTTMEDQADSIRCHTIDLNLVLESFEEEILRLS